MRSFALPGQNRLLNISPYPRMIRKCASQIFRARKKFLARNRESVSKRGSPERSSIFGNRSRATEPDGEDTLENIEWNVEQQRENLRDMPRVRPEAMSRPRPAQHARYAEKSRWRRSAS